MRDTICGIATAPGQGGIAIVRLSGRTARQVFEQVFEPVKGDIVPRRMHFGMVIDADGGVLDEAMGVYLPAPGTYTREDVCEIQCHGGDVAAHRTLKRCIDCGARAAEPGEFTRRAFLNGRIDLSRAEAVMQLVGARSEAAARASVKQLEGGVTHFVTDVKKQLVAVLSHIEAATDYPDEIDEVPVSKEVYDKISAIVAEIDKHADVRAAHVLREGASIVLTGRTNVGKSSLMNALLNQNRAIVTDIPGTTRDVLTERLMLNGIAAELSDTAGIRETGDVVEKIGVDRAREAVDRADIVLIVIDGSVPMTEEEAETVRRADGRCIVVVNKCDVAGDHVKIEGAMEVSAKEHQGLDELREELTRRLTAAIPDDCLTVERHLSLCNAARTALMSALSSISAGFPLDLCAVDLQDALRSLSEITCENPTDVMLDEIFLRFCVGK